MYHVFIKEMCYLKKVCVYVVCVWGGGGVSIGEKT